MAEPGRIQRWAARNMPRREDLARSRWIKPFGTRVLRSDLWRFTRRSVPRGVGIGLLVGIFLMIPGLQIIGAALLCVPFRANIPVAALMTFLSNPLTTPFILIASVEAGSWFGFHTNQGAIAEMWRRGAGISEWLAWLASDAAPALASGLFLIAAASGVVGYLASILVWRLWTAHKWRRRARAKKLEI